MQRFMVILGLGLCSFSLLAGCEFCPDEESVIAEAATWPGEVSLVDLIADINFIDVCEPQPAFQSPTPGTELPGEDVNFVWDVCDLVADDYRLYVGTSLGGNDLYDSNFLGVTTSHMVTGLPTDGSEVFVRLNYYNGGQQGWIDAAYQTPSLGCVIDTDGDRLPDCVETNTGVFVSPDDTGTDPMVADTDGDGIDDGDEVLGTLDGLDLPAMGLSPLQENILLEYDWFDDNLDPGTCGAHSHRPTQEIADRVEAAFANAPRVNPDGTTGVVIIQDWGQGGVFTGGNLVPDADGVIAGTTSNSDFRTIKQNNFADNRRGYFHYVLMPHRYNTNSESSGVAEVIGDDLIVSLYCFGSTNNVSNTIMHELGHNLGLRHGGNENCNNKPNYNSVMNYDYQFPGVDVDCDAVGDGVLDYSVGDRIALNENSLNENLGTCGDQLIDWNNNNITETSLMLDLNPGNSGLCGGVFTTLRDYDDWANITFLGLENIFFSGEESICENPPPFVSALPEPDEK